MSTINVSVSGVSRDAQLTWDGQFQPLTAVGGGVFVTTFNTSAGIHIYSIVVFGNPSDPWAAKVTDGTTVHNFLGVMSPSGTDTTGDTAMSVV